VIAGILLPVNGAMLEKLPAVHWIKGACTGRRRDRREPTPVGHGWSSVPSTSPTSSFSRSGPGRPVELTCFRLRCPARSRSPAGSRDEGRIGYS